MENEIGLRLTIVIDHNVRPLIRRKHIYFSDRNLQIHNIIIHDT